MVLIEKSGHILRLLSLPFHILMSNSINRKYNVPSHTHTQAQVTMHIDAKHSLAEKKSDWSDYGVLSVDTGVCFVCTDHIPIMHVYGVHKIHGDIAFFSLSSISCPA